MQTYLAGAPASRVLRLRIGIGLVFPHYLAIKWNLRADKVPMCRIMTGSSALTFERAAEMGAASLVVDWSNRAGDRPSSEATAPTIGLGTLCILETTGA